MSRLSEPNHQDLLSEFRNYLITKRSRAQLTAASYVGDAKCYLRFREQNGVSSTSPIISEDALEDFVGYLRTKSLAEATIQRKLSGVYNFWRFLYRTKRVKHRPVSVKELDINIKRLRNPTKPLSPQDYQKLNERIRDELVHIH